MAGSPSNFGSGKPTISRVPEGGGGAFRPRSVRGAAEVQATATAAPAKQTASEALRAAAPERAPQERESDESALWARLASINARRQALKDRSAQWSREGVGGDG